MPRGFRLYSNCRQVFRPRTAPEAIDLVSKLLEYTPGARLSAIEAMVHPLFDELRVEGAKMPNGKEFPLLFDFTREGEQLVVCDDDGHEILTNDDAELSVRPHLIRRLVPPHAEPELASRSIVLDNFVPIPLEQMRLSLD